MSNVYRKDINLNINIIIWSKNYENEQILKKEND